MTEKFGNIKNETNTENRSVRLLTDEEVEQFSRGYWEDCLDCKYYGHSHQCIDERQRGTCNHEYTW